MQRKRSVALLRQVQRTIERYNLLQGGDRVLVAVSGGPDSVALLGALAALSGPLGVELCVAHFNHQLRGAESLRDQRCAETVAERLGVRCVVGKSRQAGTGANLEARARDERYAFLTTVAEAQACTKIATGHTLDDQAETVLMRVLRGSGYDGLAGIRAARGRIVRPLLECSRRQVLTFLDGADLPWCVDSSNADRRFLRNRVRAEVIPLLRSINPAVIRTLASVAEIAGAELGLLDEWVACVLSEASTDEGGLRVAAFESIAPQLRGRLVRAWLRERRDGLARLNAAHIHAVLSLVTGGRPNAQVRLPGGQSVVREYDRLRFHPGGAAPVPEPAHWLTHGAALDLGSGWRIAAEVSPLDDGKWQVPVNLLSLVADADTVGLPLLVRSPRAGDRIRPLGLGGSRKLQDVFVDRKIPAESRRTCPVVETGGVILWVPGVVRGEGGRITGETRRMLRLVATKSAVAAR